MKNIAKVLIILGLFLSTLGLIILLFDKLGLKKIPGDIIIKKENFTFIFPIVSSIIISIILSIILNIFNKRG